MCIGLSMTYKMHWSGLKGVAWSSFGKLRVPKSMCGGFDIETCWSISLGYTFYYINELKDLR